uniref:DUF4114 domain-containing protein n=1 Tax=Oscillatoria sp. HE19RPO TaxID=2954806 RepID=UPI0020C3413A
MFNLFSGFKKRSEATGFKPQSKRYQGPAMRLETMRTPTGIVLDDIESTEESEFIEEQDLDWDVTEEDGEGAEEFSGEESDGDDVEVVGEGSTETTFGDEELEELPFFDLEGEEAIADGPSSDSEIDAVTDITDNSDPTPEEVEDVEFIETDGESDENTGDETAIDPEEEVLSETEEVEAEEEFETAATDETEIGEEDLDPATNEIETSEETGNDELETVDSQTDETDAEDTETAEPENLAEEESESDGIAETENNSSNEEIEETDELLEETDTEESELVADADLSNLQPKFESGTFTVGKTGKVEVDLLFDGGAYKGQISIVSLSGMEGLDPSSREFVLEAISRAASNSERGYMVIDDNIEGARFSGRLGEHNYNSGEYQGVKTFMMRPGDEFFLMLVPNGTVQQVLDNPNAGGALRPLFSLATANPNDGYHFGQIADITGDGSAFAWEDIRVDGGSDKDYNDIVLQFRGATGKAALMDDMVAAGKDWRGTELGQELIEYVTSQQLEEPISEQPEIPEEPISEQPEIPEEPVVEEPEIPEEPVAEQPSEPVTEQPSEPVAEQPSEPETPSDPEEPVAEQPSEPETPSDPEEPVAEQPEEPVAEQPSEPVAEQPSEPV